MSRRQVARGLDPRRGQAGRQAGDLAFHCPLLTDERFPFQASVEFIFSSGPEKIKGKSRAGGRAGG